MNLKITVPDPFNILTSTKAVIENAKFVEINQKNVKENAVRIANILKKSADFPDRVELLRQQLPQYSSIQIGHVIWLMSQDQSLQSRIKPYHRTYTTYY